MCWYRKSAVVDTMSCSTDQLKNLLKGRYNTLFKKKSSHHWHKNMHCRLFDVECLLDARKWVRT